jgi:type II secretory pathway predicted ATPase ExeA
MTPELINQVFHPERPVVKRGLLVGRTDEVAKTISHLETVGGHVLLCGHRGIGKTSIAKVAEASLRERHSSVVVAYLMCDQRITFDVIVDVLLTHAKIPRAALHIASPAFVAAALVNVEGFLLIDEAERLNVEDRLLIAELMKSLSDSSAKFSLCVVGVARTALNSFIIIHPYSVVSRRFLFACYRRGTSSPSSKMDLAHWDNGCVATHCWIWSG